MKCNHIQNTGQWSKSCFSWDGFDLFKDNSYEVYCYPKIIQDSVLNQIDKYDTEFKKNTGYMIVDTGYWIQDTGYRIKIHEM